MNKLQQIYGAVKQVLRERKYIFILLSFALFFFGFFVFIPVATTPGNTLTFQLSIFRAQDYFLMIFLALLVGLNFSMNIYAWRKQRQSVNISKSAATPVRGRGSLRALAASNGASGTAEGIRHAGVASATQAGFCRNCRNRRLRVVSRFFIWHCGIRDRKRCICLKVPNILSLRLYSSYSPLSLFYGRES